MPLTDHINCGDFVIAKIIVGFIVGSDGRIIFFANCGNLASLTILVNGFELNGKLHGLVQCVLVGLHNLTTNRFVKACKKQLMLEEPFSITNAFPFAFGKVGCSHRNGQGGNVGQNNLESGNVGWLGLTF